MPCAVLADEIRAGHVRALVVRVGNPALAIAGQPALRDALAALDVLVAIDVRPTETTAVATHVLPMTDHFERGDLLSGYLQAQPFLRYAPPVVAPVGERRPQWWVFAELARRLGLPAFGSARRDAALADRVVDDEVVAESIMTNARRPWAEVRATPHGIRDDSVGPGLARARTAARTPWTWHLPSSSPSSTPGNRPRSARAPPRSCSSTGARRSSTTRCTARSSAAVGLRTRRSSCTPTTRSPGACRPATSRSSARRPGRATPWSRSPTRSAPASCPLPHGFDGANVNHVIVDRRRRPAQRHDGRQRHHRRGRCRAALTGRHSVLVSISWPRRARPTVSNSFGAAWMCWVGTWASRCRRCRTFDE